MPWPLYSRERALVTIVQEAVWAPGLVWKGVEKRYLTTIWVRTPNRPARSEALCRICSPGPQRLIRLRQNVLYRA